MASACGASASGSCTKDKVTRLLRLAARFESGMVFLRRGMFDERGEQLLLAPEGSHDDMWTR